MEQHAHAPLARPTALKTNEPIFENASPSAKNSEDEANHRVANSLALIASLIRMQRNAVTREGGEFAAAEVSGMLATAAARIEAIGLVHRLLTEAKCSQSIDLGQFIHAICRPLVESIAPPDRVALTFDVQPDCRVSAGEAVPIALIVNEAVTNSIKHAHPTGVPGCLHISCHYGSGCSIAIEVVDDGIGLPENFNAETDGGHWNESYSRFVQQDQRGVQP